MSDPKDKEVDRSGVDRPPPGGSRPKRRRGLPDEASILDTKTFTSRTGKKYRIIKTCEKDAYDPPATDDHEPASADDCARGSPPHPPPADAE
jgi:hypothetical protein